MKKVLVTNRNGYTLNFYAAANYMDEDIIPYLSNIMAPCTEQELFTAYEYAHEFKYGEEWELSKVNPRW